MRGRVQKWGNSLAVRIPKPFAEEAGLRKDGEIDVSVDAGRVVVASVAARRFTLDDLLKGVKPSNLHREIASGRPTGHEAW
jgi:antitoxin MazE